MSDPTCRGPLCTFVGARNASPAKPGRCTETGGYISNFEINEFIQKGGAIKSWYDKATDSDYLVYNSVQWVAYMSDETKERRRGQYKGLNCGGTTDWAIDLQGEGRHANTGDPVYLDPLVYQKPDAGCKPPCLLVFPPSKLPSPTTIDPGDYTTSLLYGAETEITKDGEVSTVFVTHTTTITIDLPVITTDKFSYSNVNISRNQDTSSLWVGVSVPIAPVTVSLDDGKGSTTTRSLTLPAWPAVTQGPPPGADDDDDDGDGEDGKDWEFPDPISTTAAPETPEPRPTTLPTWRTIPPYIVEPVHEKDDDDDDHNHNGVIITSCKIWFFNICSSGRFKSIKWRIPPGIYPSGSPPPDIFGPPPNPKWSIKPPLPPWPQITVGRDNKITYSDEPSCKTESAELCSTTITKSETLVGTITSTATATSAHCETVYGCSLKDWDTTTTTTPTACAQPTSDNGEYKPPEMGCPAPAIVYPKDPQNVGSIPSILQGYDDYVEVGLTTEKWVAFYWIPMLGQDTMDALRQSPDVSYAYYYEETNYNMGYPLAEEDESRDWDLPYGPEAPEVAGKQNDRMSSEKVSEDFDSGLDTDTSSLNESLRFQQYHVPRDTPFWAPSQVSLPKGSIWGSPGSWSFDPDNPNGDKYTYNYDIANAMDTYVYNVHDYGIWNDHSEFLGRKIEYLDSQHTFGPNSHYMPDYRHGSGVAAQVLGNRVGICPSCTFVAATTLYPSQKIENWQVYPDEKVISQLIDILDDVKTKKRQGKAAVNMSFSYYRDTLSPIFLIMFRNLLQKLDEQRVVLVVSANNHARDEVVKPNDPPKIEIQRYPAMFGDPDNEYGGLSNMIVVGATDWKTERWVDSNYSPYVATFAPGENVHCPADKFLDNGEIMRTGSGTSYAAPQVAALANYFRSVPSPWRSQLDKPSNVKKLIQLFARRFAVYGHNVDPAERRPIIWNGQVGEHSCLREYGSKEDWAKVCPTIKDNLDDEPLNPGQPVEPCGPDQDGSPTRRRHQDGGSCPRIPGDNGPGKNIDWKDGPSAPKCGGDDHCGGELCRGYYCDSHPDIGHPPDYYDPKDPKNPHGKPPEEPTSTTTSTSPTSTPIKKIRTCLGLSITPSPQYPIYNYQLYRPGSHCRGGIFITDPNIGSSTPICDIPNDKVTFDYCDDDDGAFINEGPKFFSECGFQILLNGKRYTPRQLDPSDENNPCSGVCAEAVTSVQGMLLYEDLPGCN